MCVAWQVRVLVRELRKQMDNHIVELSEELKADKQQQPKDPDGYVYKVDQSLLSSAVSATPQPGAVPAAQCFPLRLVRRHASLSMYGSLSPHHSACMQDTLALQ